MKSGPSVEDLGAARERVTGEAHRTPVMTSRMIDEILGLDVFFKCENLQRVGAFKFRGATNAVRSLTDAEAARGVLTHSSGNHAQALALAAKRRGIRAWVVMPTDAPAVKRAAVEGYGATIVDSGRAVADREAVAARVEEETGAVFVHPYDDDRVIAGQSTAAQELFQQVPDLDAVLVPVGGGGLAAGTCLAAAAFAPDVAVYGAEPEGADDAWRSLDEGRLVPIDELPGGGADTIADGLRTQLSDRTFAVLREHMAEILRVADDDAVRWMRRVWTRLKTVIEPSAAVTVAALEPLRERLAGKRVGVILSGGNVDLDQLPWVGR